MVDRQSDTEVQPTLFPGGALAVELQALIDPEDQTVIFLVRAHDVVMGKLIHLWSTSPVDWSAMTPKFSEALAELRGVVNRNTGPF